MKTRTRFDASMDKLNALEEANKNGTLADSDAVRLALVRQMNAGEKTLPEIQAELAKIKRNAKKNGKLTRSQVWNMS